MSGQPAVLVTGGAGFIGSHTCKLLRASGYDPVTIDNLSTGNRSAVQFGPFVEADVRDTAAIRAAILDYQISSIIHFAAAAYVGESVTDPAKYHDNNVGGMISLLAAARATGIKRLVFSSSCATYGIPPAVPIREETPQHPINPYGRTKLYCEEMLREQDAAYGLPHVALRYFNAAGADPDGILGEHHAPETHLIPLALQAAARSGPALTVMGTDYPTPDGTCIRDYIHVHDLARAHVLALDFLQRGGRSVALNLGSGTGHSVRQIISAIESLTGAKVPVVLGARREGDPPILTADPSRADELLGFRTALSRIDTIIRHAAPHFGLRVSNYVSV